MTEVIKIERDGATVELALQHEAVKAFLEGVTVRKVIVVPDPLLSTAMAPRI